MAFPLTPIDNQTYTTTQGIQYIFKLGAWYVDASALPIQFEPILPLVGNSKVLYVINGGPDAGRMFRWDAVALLYVPVGGGAAVGDIKQGLQIADHSGWIRLDGRLTSTLQPAPQANASILGFATNLPDATNAYLSQTSAGSLGAVSSSNVKTLARNQLPRFTLGGTAASAGDHSHAMSLGYIVQYSGNGFPLSTPQAGGGHGTTTSAGAHTHTITTENLNNDATQLPLDITPLTMKVNTFVYLGG